MLNDRKHIKSNCKSIDGNDGKCNSSHSQISVSALIDLQAPPTPPHPYIHLQPSHLSSNLALPTSFPTSLIIINICRQYCRGRLSINLFHGVRIIAAHLYQTTMTGKNQQLTSFPRPKSRRNFFCPVLVCIGFLFLVIWIKALIDPLLWVNSWLFSPRLKCTNAVQGIPGQERNIGMILGRNICDLCFCSELRTKNDSSSPPYL